MDQYLDPTPRRRQLAREQGHVAKSHALASSLLLLAGLAVALLLGERVAAFLGDYTVEQLQSPQLSLDAEAAISAWHELAARCALAVLPALLLIMAVGVIAHVAQTGLMIHPQRLLPDAARVNPLDNAARLFSAANLGRTAMGLVQVAAVVGVCAYCLYDARSAVSQLPALPIARVAAFVCEFLAWTSLKVAAALVLLGVMDYGLERMRHERSLRMTPEELKEEMRLHQIDPQIGARRKSLHQRLARSSDVNLHDGSPRSE